MDSLRNRYRDRLVAATVRVLTHNADDKVVSNGTGFFVTPHQVLTCAHVVPELPDHTYKVRYDGEVYSATVVMRDPKEGADELYSYPDVALLTVDTEGPVDRQCAPLGVGMPKFGGQLYTYGCTLSNNNEPFWDEVDLVSEGKRVKANSSEVFIKARRGQVIPGASGSGVLDVETGEVVGMLVQTRDPRQDLGGIAVPIHVILNALAAQDHDISEANRAAVQGFDTLGAARRRFGRALQVIVNALTPAQPPHWRSMLMALDRDASGQLTIDEVALALLHLELDQLGTAMQELTRAAHDKGLAERVLDGAVPFARLSGRPWVEQDTARRLADERDSSRPRAVHLPACKRSVEVHAARAAVTRCWEVITPSTSSGDSGEIGGLPTELVRAVKLRLLDMFGEPIDDVNDIEMIDQAWHDYGTKAIDKHGKDLMVLLPAGIADAAAIEALRRTFSGCVFVLAVRTLSAAVQDSGNVLALRPSLSEEAEAQAEQQLNRIGRQINRVAG